MAGLTTGRNPPAVPDWFAGLTELKWYEIAGGSAQSGDAWQKGNRLVDVRPSNWEDYGNSFEDLVNAWTGGCAHQTLKEIYLPAQGGHAAYAGNEIYALKLNQAVPAWERIWGPSATGDITETNPGNNAAVVKNADNTPRTMHGWYQCHVDNAGRIWVGQSAPRDDGTGTHQSCYWSIPRGTGSTISGSWMFHGRCIVQTADGGPDDGTYNWGSYIDWQFGPGAYDSVGDRIYRCGAFDISEDPCVKAIPCATAVAAGAAAESGNNMIASLGRWADQTPGGLIFSDGWSAVVTDGDPRCWVVRSSGGGVHVLDVETPGTDFVARSPTGTQAPTNCGALYVPSHSAIYCFAEELGATVRKLTITGTNPTTASYAWSDLTNASGSATPNATSGGAYQGTFGKAQGILDMGNGQAALVICCNTTGATYIYKLPA